MHVINDSVFPTDQRARVHGRAVCKTQNQSLCHSESILDGYKWCESQYMVPDLVIRHVSLQWRSYCVNLQTGMRRRSGTPCIRAEAVIVVLVQILKKTERL